MTTHNAKTVGTPVNRVDGSAKVSGQARYAAEHMSDRTPLIGWIVSSDTAVGKITSLDTVRALFVRSFAKTLTMAYMDIPRVHIYIHDRFI